jgi:hypothetical protein
VAKVDPKVIKDLLQEASLAAERRHVMGSAKYGDNTFLTIDTIQHAIDEVLDQINYGMYTYVKLRLLQMGLVSNVQADGSIATGKPEGEYLWTRTEEK